MSIMDETLARFVSQDYLQNGLVPVRSPNEDVSEVINDLSASEKKQIENKFYEFFLESYDLALEGEEPEEILKKSAPKSKKPTSNEKWHRKKIVFERIVNRNFCELVAKGILK
jgi:hypothetical protein